MPDTTQTYLPVLRPDLEFYSAEPDIEGAARYTVYDPLRSTYDRIGWRQMLVLRCISARRTLTEVVEYLRANTTANADETFVAEVCKDAQIKGLVSGTLNPSVLNAQVKSAGIFKRLFAGYMYFRVPIIHPDNFLNLTIKHLRWLGSRTAFAIYISIFIIASLATMQRMGEYFSTFHYFMSAWGLLAYGLVITGLKIFHEFAHAYCAKAKGTRVPEMGAAFIFLWPVPYCNVSDSWRLKKSSDRMMIGGAGIIAEAAIASIALLAWSFAPDGIFKSICFLLSSGTLITTLFMNLNPAMRFDGYYVLCDVWKIENLQSRAFELTKWCMRKAFLGIDLPCPEQRLKFTDKLLMGAYSFWAWGYRVILYTTIATIAYYRFAKVVGIALFAGMLFSFAIKPILNEINVLKKLRDNFSFNFRFLSLMIIVIAVFLWLALPLPRSESADAICVSGSKHMVFASHSGVITKMHKGRGDKINAGDSILEVHSEKHATQLKILTSKLAMLESERRNLALKADAVAAKDEEIVMTQSKIEAVKQDLKRNCIVALTSGTIINFDEDLRVGMHIKDNEQLGIIANTNTVEIRAYINEAKASADIIGKAVEFHPTGSSNKFAGRVESVRPVPVENLEHLALSPEWGGGLPVIKTNEGIKLAENYYIVTIKINGKAPRIGRTGKVWFSGKPKSYLLETARYVYSTLLRQSSF